MHVIDTNIDIPSKAQGELGSKIHIEATVVLQHSSPVHTERGTVYSHYHVLKDSDGNLYKYKGSTFFPVNNHVNITATVKGYVRGLSYGSMVTVIRAPKSV